MCVTGLAATLGSPPEEVLKGIFEMVAVDGKGRPAAITNTYVNQETA